MKIEAEKGWHRKLAREFEQYQFTVGVLDDKPHKNPLDQSPVNPVFGNYAGGKVRKMSRQAGPLSTGEVLEANMERLGINLLSKPFEDESSDIVRFAKAFIQTVASGGKVSVKRVENLLQAIVRNPILRQEYGSNTSDTADIKGFDRHLFDTGQMFKAIKAKVYRVRR